MAAIQAHDAGDPRLSPALSAHLERQRTAHGLLMGAARDSGTLVTGMRRLGGLVVDWPVRSQRRALRNAMLATTALVERRIERDDVEAYLREREAGTASLDQA